jgi:hypothetical protein
MKGKGKGPKSRKASERAERPQPSRHKPERGKTDRPAGKMSEPQVCSSCKAIYHEGRWVWPKVANPSGQPTLCPACQRIRDELPGGEVRISGEFARAHKDEILARVRHVEEREKAEHPLQRLMAIRESEALVALTRDRLTRRDASAGVEGGKRLPRLRLAVVTHLMAIWRAFVASFFGISIFKTPSVKLALS